MRIVPWILAGLPSPCILTTTRYESLLVLRYTMWCTCNRPLVGNPAHQPQQTNARCVEHNYGAGSDREFSRTAIADFRLWPTAAESQLCHWQMAVALHRGYIHGLQDRTQSLMGAHPVVETDHTISYQNQHSTGRFSTLSTHQL